MRQKRSEQSVDLIADVDHSAESATLMDFGSTNSGLPCNDKSNVNCQTLVPLRHGDAPLDAAQPSPACIDTVQTKENVLLEWHGGQYPRLRRRTSVNPGSWL